jgi:20S proteasome subunit alpha 7
MLVTGSNRRVFHADSHVGVAVTGFTADGRQIVHRAREEAENYKDTYGHKIVPSLLANRLGLYVHYFTRHGSLRQLVTSALVAEFDYGNVTLKCLGAVRIVCFRLVSV